MSQVIALGCFVGGRLAIKEAAETTGTAIGSDITTNAAGMARSGWRSGRVAGHGRELHGPHRGRLVGD